MLKAMNLPKFLLSKCLSYTVCCIGWQGVKFGGFLLVSFPHMWLDFGKPTKLSQVVFQEIPILNIEATVVLLCWIVATPDELYNCNSRLASVL